MSRIGPSTFTTSMLMLIVIAATGCRADEFASEPLKKIERTAVKEMRSLDAVRMVGWTQSNGRSMELDLSVDRTGGCSGTISMDDGTAQFRANGTSSYVKGNRAFWEASTGSEQTASRVLALLGDRWAKLPAGDELDDACDMDALFEDFGEDTGPKKANGRKGESTDVRGTDAIELVYTKGPETTVVWVATEAPHTVLKMQRTGGKEPGRFSFSDFDEQVDVEVPKGDQVVDFGKM